MNSQSHSIVYYDKRIQTLDQALQRLSGVSNTILKYNQTITIKNRYNGHYPMQNIVYKPEDNLLYISFPSEYWCVSTIKNNSNCKMVTYHEDALTDSIKEVLITPNIYLNTMQNPSIQILIYTEGIKNIKITFDVYLRKPYSKL